MCPTAEGYCRDSPSAGCTRGSPWLTGRGGGGAPHTPIAIVPLNYGILETSHETLRVCLLLDPDVEEMEDSEPRTAK